MPAKASSSGELDIQPLSAKRWPDLVKLFGERGACGGCWCMWWRLKRAMFEKFKGEGNKRRFKKIVTTGETPGLIAYAKGEPVAWCAIAPRETYPVLERSRVLGRVDDQPVWSVTCFFVARPFRGRGVTTQLLKSAAAYARRQGARIVEGYPVEPRKGRMPEAFAWTGLAAAFRKAGFAEVARRSKTRPIMRLAVRAH
ncbi:MAG: GNAT family N-acetyltransferase [Acidobacteria bacterium]|nr:GNAT family N-acetyltransferase [Acidobacteriota bacterium]